MKVLTNKRHRETLPNSWFFYVFVNKNLVFFYLMCYYHYINNLGGTIILMEKLKELIKKFCTREVILYVIFGVLTTCVNIVSFMILSSFFHIEENFASNIGIVIAVLFAYFTNRKLVFNSTASTFIEKLKEFGKFILGRAFTMIIEIVGVFLLNDVIHSFYGMFSDNMAYLINKVLITIIVIILNFFISKFFAFKKEN